LLTIQKTFAVDVGSVNVKLVPDVIR